MKARTTKRAAQERQYLRAVPVFLEANPVCQGGPERLPRAGCTGRSEQVHHKQGRDGDRLLDQSRWAALCGRCHHWVTHYPEDGRKAGLLLRRNAVAG